MVKRILVTALTFGAIGGATLAALLGLGWALHGYALLATLIAIFGALVGVAAATLSLVTGAVVGGIAGRHGSHLARPVGAATTMLATATTLAIVQLAIGGKPAATTIIVLSLVCGLYAAIVAWLRLPWIYAGRRIQSNDFAIRTRM